MTDCIKLTVYLGERQRVGSRFAADEILDLLARRGVASSVLLRGIAGFGGRHVLRTDQSLTLSEDPPVTIAAVDLEPVISSVAEEIAALLPRGLITLERARQIGEAAELPDSQTVRLSVALGRNQRVDGTPAFRTACELMSRHHFAGSTVFLGVDGTVGGQRRRARFFSRNPDIPLVTIGVGATEQAERLLPVLHRKLGTTLLTAERVTVCKRDGVLLTGPAPVPATDRNGRQLWQKLMVYTSEDTLTGGVPIHRALVRRLLQSRSAAGATVLRGIWGFHGDHPPRGDSLIQFGRRVPVSTVVVDSPDNIARSFEIVDELTGRHGLVTCETVPAMLTLGEGTRRGGLDLADT